MVIYGHHGKIKKLNYILIMINFQYQKNTLRGLHGDKKTWKLVSCVFGRVFFVVVNNNLKSKNYLKKKPYS